MLMEQYQALQVNQIKENTPYLLEPLGIGKLMHFYHKTYFFLNTTSLRELYINNLQTIYIKFSHSNLSDNVLLKQLSDVYDHIHEQLLHLSTHKTKRSLINGLGSMIRYVTGNLDQNDLNEIITNMQTLRDNENKLNNQNSQVLTIIHELTQRFENNTNLLSQRLVQIENTLNNITDTLIIQQQLLNAIFNAQKFERFLSNLLNAITFSLNDELYTHLLSINDIQLIENNLLRKFPAQALLPLSQLPFIEILHLFKLNTIMTNDQLIFIVKIPILFPTKYIYQKVYPLFTSDSLLMLPTYEVFQHEETSFVNECRHMDLFTLCYTQLKDHCKLDNLTNCVFVNIPKNESRTYLLSDNNLLISTQTTICGYDNCNQTKICFSHSTVISELCDFEIANERYTSNKTLKPFTIPRINTQDISFTILRENLNDISYADLNHEIYEISQNNKLKNLVWHQNTIHVYSILMWLIVILCFVCFLLYKLRICKNDLKQEVPEGVAIPLTSVPVMTTPSNQPCFPLKPGGIMESAQSTILRNE